MKESKLIGTGVFTAIASSLCCITPVLALIAGSGSIASAFSWIEPARPYMVGITIAVLGFAWYQKFKPHATENCGCAVDDLPFSKAEKTTFFQSKAFLLLVTVFAGLMITFPSYAKVFFPKNEKTTLVVEKSNIQTVELNIKGMSCEVCEEEVNHEVNKLPGIIQSTVSYKKKNAIIKFDDSKTTMKNITDAVELTGYTVINPTRKN